MAGRFLLSLMLVGIGAYYQMFQVQGAVQKITLYQHQNRTGDGVVLTGKYPNMTNIKYIFDTMTEGSYCAVGRWGFYSGPNYGWEGQELWEFSPGDVEEVCLNFYLYNPHWTQSLRHLGPPDFSTPAISFYEGHEVAPGLWHRTAGKEYVVTDLAGNGLDFVPKTALLFGTLSWTLYSGGNFDGEMFCAIPTEAGVITARIDVDSMPFKPRSVARGCDFTEVQNNIQLFKQGFK